MAKSKQSRTATETYEVEVLLVECTNAQHRKVIRREPLGCFASKKEANEMIELVELPDVNQIIVI